MKDAPSPLTPLTPLTKLELHRQALDAAVLQGGLVGVELWLPVGIDEVRAGPVQLDPPSAHRLDPAG